jgi:transglutaminase-like putative cysteine protease
MTVLAALLLAAPSAAGSFDPWTQSARYEFEYRIDLSDLPAGARRRLWIPMPSDSAAQKVLATRVDSPWPHRIGSDAYGNRIIHVEVVHGVAEGRVERGGPLDPRRYLEAQRKIPLDGLIAEIAERESRGIEGAPQKIRSFYDFVVRTMRYSKQGKGWGQGDAIWACTSRYGNCTDFHSLLIGMARSQGIPARFLIGFPIPPTRSEGEIPGYHCWAELYQAGHGWRPVDASEAKKSGRSDAYFGSLPSDRIAFTVGRDLTLVPSQQGEPLNYFIYPYAEVDGADAGPVPLRVRFKRLSPTMAMVEEP